MSVQQSELTDLRLRVGAEHRLDELYVSKADDSILGLNFSDRKLLLGTLTSYQCYCFNEIAGIQSQRNGATLTQTNRGSQLAGAAIGGVAFGGIGALAGALSGSTRSSERLTGLRIVVTIDDHKNPLHHVTFVRSNRGKGLDPTNPDVARVLSVAETFYAHLVLAMRTAVASTASSAATETRQVVHATDAQLLHVEVREWGKVSAPLLGVAFQKARPELTTMEAMIAGLQAWKRAPTVLSTASTGEGNRLRKALLEAGAIVEGP